MNWIKIKNVFCPQNNYAWMNSHASYPWAEQIQDEKYKIFFSCRDIENRSSIGHLIFDMDTFSIIDIPSEPILAPGELGTFDDSGVSISCMIDINNSKYLYYLGWNLMVTVPWRNTIGLAIKNNRDDEYRRYSKAPILGIDHIDPFTLTYPFVMFDEGEYKMWYGTSLFWGPKVTDTQHVIKFATSKDGINWKRNNHICINTGKGEFAIVKPFVIKEDGLYKMWYSFRDKYYNLGYAESKDGLNWNRFDNNVGIHVSEIGWDSEMICYAYVFDYKNSRFMLYNGNGYGKSGFGLAILR